MRIIRRGREFKTVTFDREFRFKEDRFRGFLFPCTQDGDLLWNQIDKDMRETARRCLSGELPVNQCGIQMRTYTEFLPDIGLCRCGTQTPLRGTITECPGCGRQYTGGGSLLSEPNTALENA